MVMRQSAYAQICAPQPVPCKLQVSREQTWLTKLLGKYAIAPYLVCVLPSLLLAAAIKAMMCWQTDLCRVVRGLISFHA